MAIKKSELYSSLWASCDELRGGMDASQYKDYVLVLLFIKYISDQYAGKPFAAITVPEGSTFDDMVELKGKTTIGDDINKKIIEPIAKANQLVGTIDVADFDSTEKLGSGKEKVNKLTNLIAIFERPELDFSKNKAEGDDILGDAYEYLMRHFATESGKSKGQFYTPAEVSRIMAKILGINETNTTKETTVYDPTCGSGSLLLKVADEADGQVSLYGQENDVATAGLARMNMVLHNQASAVQTIVQGNTMGNPLHTVNDNTLKTFDYVVANPPFSSKNWSNGIEDPMKDKFDRFKDFGVPPGKNGDYAFLLHVLRSMKSSKGKGAIILPHGVLFRGNAEAIIREKLIRQGYIKGIIGLPANLFYGTGIPACIIMLDKEGAAQRKAIFMIDASKGYMKDGNKNRLRSQDIHLIVDEFNKQTEIPKYSRIVPISEIERNEWNLNLPRYIDSREPEDIQDINGHLLGGIPKRDVDAMDKYWKVCPELRRDLFALLREGYLSLKVDKSEIRPAVAGHEEFDAFTVNMMRIFSTWQEETTNYMKELTAGCKPKQVINEVSEKLLLAFKGQPLINPYDVYQHLMDYWTEAMQDDLYLISTDGWGVANEVTRKVKVTKSKGKEKKTEIKGLEGVESKLLPPELLIARYFAEEQEAIDAVNAALENIAARKIELEEEHSGEEGAFAELDKVNKTNVAKLYKSTKGKREYAEENEVYVEYLEQCKAETEKKALVKDLSAKMERLVWDKYPTLTLDEVKTLVVEDKWKAKLQEDMEQELERIGQNLAQRVKELAERYENTLPKLSEEVEELETKVNGHLEKMGYSWS